MRFRIMWATMWVAALVLLPIYTPDQGLFHISQARAAELPATLSDDDHDGIDDAAEQLLANQFAPLIFIEPDESNYPVNVDWFLQQDTHVEYHEDCFGDIDDRVSHDPVGSQQELLGPPWVGHANCGEDDEGYSHPPHRDITTIATDPDGQKSDGSRTTGYSDQQTFVLPDLPDEVHVGSLDPKQWVTYFHAYPTSDGGIMLQYWHIFAYNELSLAGFGRHGGDWDATIHVQLAQDLTLEGVWYSRHGDDHPGTYFNAADLSFYQSTHPLMAIDGGGHAAFASPQDACANGSEIGSTVSWTSSTDDPTDPDQLRVIECDDSATLTGQAGGVTWETWDGGNVRSAGELTNALAARVSSYGGMVNVGEYNPCTPVTCNGSQQASTLLAGQFYPLNGQIFIRYEGRWGSLPHCDAKICATPPRGPVFQGWAEGDESHNGIYTAWYNQASNEPANPISTFWRQPPTTALALNGPDYRPPVGTQEYIANQTTFSLDAQQNAAAAKFGAVQLYARFFQAAQAPPPFSLYTGPFSLAGADGSYSIEFYAVDALHNQENVQQRTFVKDSVQPQSTLTIGLPQYATYPVPVIPSNTPLTLTAQDESSGVQSVSYRVFLQGAPAPTYTTQSTNTVQFTVGGSEGLYEVDTFATDNAGNVEALHTQIIHLANTRVLNGLQAMYTFEENGGTIINDVSGIGKPLNLVIADPSAAAWSLGALTLTTPTRLASAEPARSLITAISTTNELTFEAWITPVATQHSLGSLVSFANDRTLVDALLAEDGKDGRYQAWLRTKSEVPAGTPQVRTSSYGVATPSQHVVLTRDTSGLVRIYVNGVLKKRATHKGALTSWDVNYYLVLGNTLRGDFPWLGTYQFVALYNRALSPAEIGQNYQAGSEGAMTPAVIPKLQVIYTFQEGSGATVHDVSGSDTPLDLQIADTSATRWVPGGLQVLSPTMIMSLVPATKISESARASDELTLEAWIVPSDLKREGVGRIVTLSADQSHRNIALSQERENGQQPYYRMRIRTTDTDDGGNNPPLFTPEGSLTNALQHIVLTRDADKVTRLYVNGVERRHVTTSGSFANWDTTYRLQLANDFSGDPSWQGEYQFIAIYNRALSPAEVNQRFRLGPTVMKESGTLK